MFSKTGILSSLSLLLFGFIAVGVTASSRDTPDVRLVKEIAWQLWLDRDVIIRDSFESLSFSKHDTEKFINTLESDVNNLEPDARVDCPACMVRVAVWVTQQLDCIPKIIK